MTERTLHERLDAVRQRLPLGDLVGRDTALTGGASAKQQRAVCPFHNGKSRSFAIYTGERRAHCFGCGWQGDVVSYVRDRRGLSFIDALAECELLAGIAEQGATSRGSGAITRERSAPAARRARGLIEPIELGRFLWRIGRTEPAAVRRYFRGRGVPAAVLGDARLAEFRYVGLGPVMPWAIGGRASSVPQAPALVALVRRPQWLTGEDEAAGRLEFVPCGVHVTFLNPDGTGTMLRRKPWAKPDDDDPMMPKRKMLGPVGGGCVLLGAYRPEARLWVGEGNETVLSGMALGEAGSDDVGVATLSLGNLQGEPLLWRHRTWPLHAIVPDPARPPFTIPGHRGRVTGLVDSDMASLRGMIDPHTGTPGGEAVVEHKGGPIVRRAITGAERARICGELFVKGWRAAGVAQVEAVRAPQGMDFNDVVQAEAA